MAKAKRVGLKERYSLMTRGLDWETTYQPMDEVFPYDKYEGIKIIDWDKWEDPFRLTMECYWKYQSEKERKLYAILDAFQQNNGQLNISDARYMNAIKLWLQGITPLEYAAHRGFAHAGRAFRGAGARLRIKCSRSTSYVMRKRSCMRSVTTTSFSTACMALRISAIGLGICRSRRVFSKMR